VASGPGSEYGSSDWWDDAVSRGPAEMVDVARAVLGDPARTIDERALACRAMTRAAYELGRLADASRAATHAVALAEQANDPSIRTRVVLTAAAVLAETGELAAGLAAIDELLPHATGFNRGRAVMQRAYLLHHAGRLVEALEAADEAHRELADAPTNDLIRVLINRGLIRLQLAHFGPAEADFEEVIRLADGAGHDWNVALAHGNLAVLYGRSRRLPEALRRFAMAEELYQRESRSERALAILHIDRAEVLMHSGMLADAVDAARAALRVVTPSGNTVQLGDAELMVARTELADGHPQRALRSAEQAAATFQRTGRADMSPHARALVAQAGLAAATTPDDVAKQIVSADHVASALRDDGWIDQANALAVAAVRAGRAAGLHAEIVEPVEFLRRRRGDSRRDVAVAGWYAEGVARSAAGDHRGALAACRAGLDLVATIVAEAPDLERRAAASWIATDLDGLALDAAVAAGDVSEVLAVAEQTRARALAGDIDGVGAPASAALADQLAAELGDRVLVVWAVVADRLQAVVVGDGQPRLVDVADATDAVRARDRLVRWLDQAASEPRGAADLARGAAAALDELVLVPLALPTGRPLVVVPDGPVHGVPWGALPGVAGRVVTQAPRAGLWIAAAQRAASPARSAGAVIGPDVSGAATERQALLTAYPQIAIASGPGATREAAAAVLRDCDLVHLAAHGRFRADRPLMSTLRLTGGDDVLAELLPERVAARLVVLSSCEGGAHGSVGGSESLGLAALLLARGAGAVVAPLSAVSDLACGEFVAELHAGLAAGLPVGAALAELRQRWLHAPALGGWAIGAAFACYGSDTARVR